MQNSIAARAMPPRARSIHEVCGFISSSFLEALGSWSLASRAASPALGRNQALRATRFRPETRSAYLFPPGQGASPTALMNSLRYESRRPSNQVPL